MLGFPFGGANEIALSSGQMPIFRAVSLCRSARRTPRCVGAIFEKDTSTKKKPEVFVIQHQAAAAEAGAADPEAKKVPIPDPTPDEPEPIRLPDSEEELEIPDIDDLVIAVPEAAPPVETGPIWVTGDVQKPVKVFDAQAQYTDLARRARIQGVVILQTTIDKEGNVTDVKLLKSLPMGLGEAAVEAVKQWKWEPPS